MSQLLVSNLHMDIIILEGSGTKTRPPKCCLGVFTSVKGAARGTCVVQW